jgi:glycogenin
MPSSYAFVTLLTSDSYLPGALVVHHALRSLESPKPINPFNTVCIVTPATVSVRTIKTLRSVFDLVVGVEDIRGDEDDRGRGNLILLGRTDLGSTLTKLHLWRLVQFKRIIFLDADTLPIKPLSHLFTSIPSEIKFSAAPDSGWPDCFNSGMMVLNPDAGEFERLMKIKKEKGSWDGGDQGLLNDAFEGNWNRLSFGYNVTPTAYYTSVNLFLFIPLIRRETQISIRHD